MLNTSDDDFASPVVFKKLKAKATVLNTKMKEFKANNTRKKSKKKQVTLHQMLRDNSQILDTNEEHLQVALALSKSTSEMLQEDNKKDDCSWNLNHAMKDPDTKGTLLEFGFKTDRSKMSVENRLKKILPTKKKTSKFRFVTPILSLRTEEERQTLIQTKISLILSQNTETIKENPKIPYPELSSIHLNEIKCSECCIFRLNHALDSCPRNNFKVSDLDIDKDRSRCGSLLKDWGRIAMRDPSPEPQQREGSKEGKLSNEQKKEECRDKTVIQFKSSLKADCVLSPDLFDDTLGEKSTDVEINSGSKSIKRNLGCIFSQDKSGELEGKSSEINLSDEKTSGDSLKRNVSLDNSIYHFDGYDTDDDFPFLSASFDGDEMNSITKKDVLESNLQKDDASWNENRRKYRISSSDDENIMNVDKLSENLESNTSNIDENLRMNRTENICDTPLRSFSKCNKSEIFLEEIQDSLANLGPNTSNIDENLRMNSTENICDTPLRSLSKCNKSEIFLEDFEERLETLGNFEANTSDKDGNLRKNTTENICDTPIRSFNKCNKSEIFLEDLEERPETLEYLESNIDENLRMNTTANICDTPIRSFSNKSKILKKTKISCELEDVHIILDSDEELMSSSSHSLNLMEEEKEIEFSSYDNTEDSLSNNCDKLIEKEFSKQSTSKITDFLPGVPFREGLDENASNERTGCDSKKRKSLSENDYNKFNETSKSFREDGGDKNSILLGELKSSNENKRKDSNYISRIDNKSNISFRNDPEFSPILHCNKRFSYRDSMSLNVTEHINEILAGGYNQINSLTLSDVDCSSNLKNRNSVIETKTSNCNITKELTDIITEKNASLETSVDSSGDVICISDDELNYSCATNNLEKIEEFVDEPKQTTLFKKYSSFTETPTRKKTSFNRHKSESFITPKKNMTIKTKNITPMIEYDALNTPDIVKELDKFGLKPLKRKRGVNLLKYIYEATHPTVNQVDTEQASKKIRSNECTSIPKTLKSDRIKEIFGKSWIESIPESEIIFEKKRPSKVHICQIPLQIVWNNFLIENPQIYENVLLYEPVQVEEIYKMLKREGFKFHLQDLITFFDRKCITIKVPQNHRNMGKS